MLQPTCSHAASAFPRDKARQNFYGLLPSVPSSNPVSRCGCSEKASRDSRAIVARAAGPACPAAKPVCEPRGPQAPSPKRRRDVRGVVMPSIYENPGPRRNIDYRPGTIVGAGRLHPKQRIEPRIAPMGTDKEMPFLVTVFIRDIRVIRGQRSLHQSCGKRLGATGRRPAHVHKWYPTPFCSTFFSC